MSDWRRWNAYDWSDALLEHYFGIVETTEPVESLVVANGELARVVDDPNAVAEEVAQEFERKVLALVGEKTFWFHASEKVGLSKPYYLAHLILACLVATEFDEDDEESYISRLATVTRNARGDLNIDIMATLWKELVEWLKLRPHEYRQLTLPNPGGWTRIGYTVKLAFPSRRDQRMLARRLTENNLAIEDPPSGLVLDVVSRASRPDFSSRFWTGCDEFRRKFQSGASPSELRKLPFWVAVRAATGIEVLSAISAKWAFLASDDGYDLEMRLVSDGVPEVVAPIELRELEQHLGRWTHEATVQESTMIPVADLLSRRSSLPGLSQLIAGGVIPLFEEAHGELESTSHRDMFPEVRAALVEESLASEFKERFGTRATKRRSIDIDGWMMLDDVALKTVKGEEVVGTHLERCLLIQEAPMPKMVRIVGGIRIGTETWIGFPGCLPSVDVEGAQVVELELEGSQAHLVPQTSTRWNLPSATYNGPAAIRAECQDQSLHRKLTFTLAPSTESFRQPSTLEAWVFDNLGRAFPFSRRNQGNGEPDGVIDVERSVFLGRDVGVFVDAADDATWQVSEFAGDRVVRLLVPPNEAIPKMRSANSGARRRWRRYLASGRDGSSVEESGILAYVTSRLDSLPELRETPDLSNALLSNAKTTDMHARTEDVVSILVAASNRRIGMEQRWVREIFSELFELDRESAFRVMRAWQESELMDEIVNVRFSGRRFLAVEPYLSIFRGPFEWFATLSGLSLAFTRNEVRHRAEDMGIKVATVGCLSPFVPTTILMKSDSVQFLTKLAEEFRLRTSFMSSTAFVWHEGRDLLGPVPQMGYAIDSQIETRGESSIRKRWRVGAPTLWSVDSPSGSTWSHFYDAARFWCDALTDGIRVSERPPHEFSLDGGYLPMAAARWLNTVSGVRSGPIGDGAGAPYVYSTPSALFRSRFLKELDEFAAGVVKLMTNSSVSAT